MRRVLLIEPGLELGRALAGGLQAFGYHADSAPSLDAQTAALLANRTYEAVAANISVVPANREMFADWITACGGVPVLVTGPREALPDIVRAMDAGAADFLIHPFDAEALGARLRAALRRTAAAGATGTVKIGDVELNPVRREVRCGGAVLPLSAREYILLAVLMTDPGRVFTRAELERHLYGMTGEISSNAVEVHVHNLRRKLGERFIRNARGRGYWIEPDDG